MHSFDLSVLFVAALFALSAVSESKEPWPQLCYWAKDRKAAREFIPCYVKDGKNELWPFQPCCMAGDVCLNYGACFNEKTNTTYHYGCNDKDYEALWCPRKCNLNLKKSYWTSLLFCPKNKNWICYHPETCKKDKNPKCPEDPKTRWDEFIQSLPPVECEDIDPSIIAGPTGGESPMTASPLTYDAHGKGMLTLPPLSDHGKIREYLSRKGTAETKTTPRPPPPSPTPIPSSTPAPPGPSSLPPPRPQPPSHPPPSKSSSNSLQSTRPSTAVSSPNPLSSKPSQSADSSASQSAESKPSLSKPRSMNTTSRVSSPLSNSSLAVTSPTATQTVTEDPLARPLEEKKSSMRVITGAVIGAVGGLLALLGFFIWICKRRRTENDDRPLKGKQISDPKPIDHQPYGAYDSANAYIPTMGELGSPREMLPPPPGSAISTGVAKLASPDPGTPFPGVNGFQLQDHFPVETSSQTPAHPSMAAPVSTLDGSSFYSPQAGEDYHQSGTHPAPDEAYMEDQYPTVVDEVQRSSTVSGSGIPGREGAYDEVVPIGVDRTSSQRSSLRPLDTHVGGGSHAPAGVFSQVHKQRARASTFKRIIPEDPYTEDPPRVKNINEVLLDSEKIPLEHGLKSPEEQYLTQGPRRPQQSPEYTNSPGLVSAMPPETPGRQDFGSPISNSGVTMPEADYMRAGYRVDSSPDTEMPRPNSMANDEPSGPVELHEKGVSRSGSLVSTWSKKLGLG